MKTFIAVSALLFGEAALTRNLTVEVTMNDFRIEKQYKATHTLDSLTNNYQEIKSEGKAVCGIHFVDSASDPNVKLEKVQIQIEGPGINTNIASMSVEKLSTGQQQLLYIDSVANCIVTIK